MLISDLDFCQTISQTSENLEKGALGVFEFTFSRQGFLENMPKALLDFVFERNRDFLDQVGENSISVSFDRQNNALNLDSAGDYSSSFVVDFDVDISYVPPTIPRLI